jgi:hypothetical protein
MSSPIATPSPPPPTTTSPPSDRLKAVKQFDETKAGVKGLIDSGIKTIPSIFIHPPETLSDLAPGSGPEPEIPTIDLSNLQSSRSTVVDQIHHAASTVGFFQVINHGVAPELLRSVIVTSIASAKYHSFKFFMHSDTFDHVLLTLNSAFHQ